MKPAIWNHANDPKKITANFLSNRDERTSLIVQPERPPSDALPLLPPPPPSLPVPSIKLSPISDPLCWKTTIDSNTGKPFYWNETANITTWEAPACLKATMEWKQEQARTKGLNELAAARRQLLGTSGEEDLDEHDKYFLGAPPGITRPSPATTTAASTTAKTAAAGSAVATEKKLSPDEEKKQKEKAAFAKWQERQQATKKPRLMTSTIKKAQNAVALAAVDVAVKDKEGMGGAADVSGPSLPHGRAAPVLEVKPVVAKKEQPPVSAGETCNACLAFGYKMEQVVTEVLGQTITHYYCWDCVPGSAAAARKARKPKRTPRIKGEGLMQER